MPITDSGGRQKVIGLSPDSVIGMGRIVAHPGFPWLTRRETPAEAGAVEAQDSRSAIP
jgi:hypothetical protein